MKGNTMWLSSTQGKTLPPTEALHVLVAEPDPMLRSLYRNTVSENPQYVLTGTAETSKALFSLLARAPVHLLLLDVFLADFGGSQGLRRLRQEFPRTDFIVLSAGDQPDVVREALCIGAFDFLVKPFSFERLRRALNAYTFFHHGLTQKLGPWCQEELDTLLQYRRGHMDESRKEERSMDAFPPKGLQAKLLDAFFSVLQSSSSPLSAREAGLLLRVARSTARRYLEYLVDMGKANFVYGYREIGRPVKCYQALPPCKQNRTQQTISLPFS